MVWLGWSVYLILASVVLCEFHLYFCLCWVSGNTTQIFYFVFKKSLESFYIPCFVLCSAVVEHCHSCVCIIYMFACVLTEIFECLITVFLINITKYFSINSSFLSDITCGISPTSTTTYSLFRVGKPCVRNCILKTDREVGQEHQSIITALMVSSLSWTMVNCVKNI